MKVSHILYKVNNLDAAVKSWRDQGFIVEYGKEKNPYNAVIYFSNGPYIELFHHSGMPKIAKLILRIIGKGFMSNLMNNWENAEEGLIAVALENYDTHLDKELEIFKRYNIKYFKTHAKRFDTKKRLLEYDVAFPNQATIPFLMTYFNIDPKPINFVHPNGITAIESIDVGVSPDYHSMIKELCDDPILKLYDGHTIRNLLYKKKAE